MRKAFTLMEVIVVLVIFAIIALGIIVPSINKAKSFYNKNSSPVKNVDIPNISPSTINWNEDKTILNSVFVKTKEGVIVAVYSTGSGYVAEIVPSNKLEIVSNLVVNR